ncbi:tyrosyl-tRNA synthetase domain protein [Mycobacterium xenopi 3993]|nr:tyrosyl-tRNA synthetase domain protein [Mycobacterium xenopi 3993]
MGVPILDELAWRGLIAQSTDLDALAAEAARGPLTVYAGFDPTAPSLHAVTWCRYWPAPFPTSRPSPHRVGRRRYRTHRRPARHR